MNEDELWRNIGLSNKFAICVFDKEFRLIGFNKAHNDEFFRVNGYYTKIGDVFPDLFVPEQGPVMRALMARALAGETFSVVEDFGNPVLGKPYWEITYAPLRNPSGEIIGAYHQAVDISERLVAQAERDVLERRVAEQTTELLEQRARLRTIFETSLVFQGLLTKNGVLIDSNATSLLAIGRPLSAVVGTPFWDTPWFARTAGMADIVRKAVAQAANNELVRQDIQIELPVGGLRWFDFAMRPMRSDAGEVIAIVFEALETTERRRAEDALRQSQKLKAMGQLTGGIAHDFNNLLMIVSSSFEIIRRRPDDQSRVLSTADAGLQAVERGSKLTRQLLTFARKQNLRSETINPNAVLRDFEPLARRAVGEAIDLLFDLSPDVYLAHFDAGEFEAAVLNLIVNARDALPANGGRVVVSSRNRSIASAVLDGPDTLHAGDYVVIVVADNGSGMDEATLQQAFDPFFTTKEFGKGSGLGLSQVYGFARATGGTVKIISALHHGATIEIWLPRSTRDERAVSIGAARAPALPAVRRAADGETVLAVEDESQVLAAVVENLKDLGYRVLAARDANEALKLLRSPEPIDILFSDIVMPGGINGIQLATEASRIRPGMHVVLTSGYTGESLLGDHEIPPDITILSKPYRQNELAERLKIARRA